MHIIKVLIAGNVRNLLGNTHCEIIISMLGNWVKSINHLIIYMAYPGAMLTHTYI